MKFNSDIDIDFGNRDDILKHINHIPAAMRNNTLRKHATGIYVTEIPRDALHDMANIDYVVAEKRGYVKLDLLNVHVYSQVKDETHLAELMNREPDWEKLKEKKFVEQLIHLANHYQSIRKMPEPIDSIPRLAMFLAVIRPAKKHLIGLPWKEVAKTVWDKDDTGYTFKKSHSVSYAHLVAVHMNLLSSSS
jgi:hypothetical protein